MNAPTRACQFTLIVLGVVLLGASSGCSNQDVATTQQERQQTPAGFGKPPGVPAGFTPGNADPNGSVVNPALPAEAKANLMKSMSPQARERMFGGGQGGG